MTKAVIRANLISKRATTLVKLDRHGDLLADLLADTEAPPLLNSASFKTRRTRARSDLYLECSSQPSLILRARRNRLSGKDQMRM